MAKMFPRLLKAALGLTGAALAVFHGWLFVWQAAAGRLEDPWVIFRWIAATALIVALGAIQRRAGTLWGRKSIAIWLLAAILHGPAIADNEGFTSFIVPAETAASILQLASSAVFAIGVWLLAALLAARRGGAPMLSRLVPVVNVRDRFSAGHAWRFSARPPPLRR